MCVLCSIAFEPGALGGSTSWNTDWNTKSFPTTASLPLEHRALCFHAGMAHAPRPVLRWSEVAARRALAERPSSSRCRSSQNSSCIQVGGGGEDCANYSPFIPERLQRMRSVPSSLKGCHLEATDCFAYESEVVPNEEVLLRIHTVRAYRQIISPIRDFKSHQNPSCPKSNETYRLFLW